MMPEYYNNNSYIKYNEGMKDIDDFVLKHYYYIKSILVNENTAYNKATLLYRFLIFKNIEYDEKYIIEYGSIILKNMLEVFYKHHIKEPEYNDKNLDCIIKKDDDVMKKMNIINFALNTP